MLQLNRTRSQLIRDMLLFCPVDNKLTGRMCTELHTCGIKLMDKI